MRTNDCMRRKVVWFTLVIAACVLVVLVANELFLQPGQGGLFNRGNQSVPLIPALEFSRPSNGGPSGRTSDHS
jgi:hypothetical protein